jgi:hypothetical protein
LLCRQRAPTRGHRRLSTSRSSCLSGRLTERRLMRTRSSPAAWVPSEERRCQVRSPHADSNESLYLPSCFVEIESFLPRSVLLAQLQAAAWPMSSTASALTRCSHGFVAAVAAGTAAASVCCLIHRTT